MDDEGLINEGSTTAKDVDGWDFLTHLQLVAMLENEFSIKFTLGKTSEDIMKYLV